MDSDFFTGGYSAKQERERLAQKLIDLHSELHGAFENSRGRSQSDIEKEMYEIEVRIKRLDEDTPDAKEA